MSPAQLSSNDMSFAAARNLRSMAAGQGRDSVMVREARREDWTQWLRLWEQYHGRDGAAVLPRAVTERTWERFFQQDERMKALVAELEGRLVGFAHMILHASTSAVAPSVFLQDLFVDASTRRRGVGRGLVEAAYDHARAAGAGRMYWHVLDSNTAAIKLYECVASRSGHVVFQKNL
jgi:GNAT superfamily N-acetyltransferase